MSTLQNTKVDRDSTRNTDMKGRRVIGAAPSVDAHDYVIQKELSDDVAALQASINSLKQQVEQAQARLNSIVDATGEISARAGFRAFGSAGYNATVITAKLTTLGTNGSMTFTGGILTGIVGAT